MTTRVPYLSVAAALGCFIAVQQGSAQVVLLGNLAASPNDNGTSTTISSTSWKSVGFTTPNQAYTIDSVNLRLSSYDGADNPFVGFYTGSATEATTPEGLVGSLLTDATPNAGSLSTFTFTPSGTLTLAANTTYWLVVGGESGTFSWRTGNPGVSPTGDSSFIMYKGSTAAGEPWNANASTFFNNFEIQATPVPEPAHYALAAGLGLVGFGVVRRIRAKAA